MSKPIKAIKEGQNNIYMSSIRQPRLDRAQTDWRLMTFFSLLEVAVHRVVEQFVTPGLLGKSISGEPIMYIIMGHACNGEKKSRTEYII